jgi:hypothetical protein
VSRSPIHIHIHIHILYLTILHGILPCLRGISCPCARELGLLLPQIDTGACLQPRSRHARCRAWISYFSSSVPLFPSTLNRHHQPRGILSFDPHEAMLRFSSDEREPSAYLVLLLFGWVKICQCATSSVEAHTTSSLTSTHPVISTFSSLRPSRSDFI